MKSCTSNATIVFKEYSISTFVTLSILTKDEMLLIQGSITGAYALTADEFATVASGSLQLQMNCCHLV